jgi:hypothetical protein
MPITHRLLVLSCLALWCAHPAEGKTGPAKGKGSSMTQRILFHPSPTVEWLKGLQVETLGKIPGGTWLAADDATALELLKRDKSTRMLYPTRGAYDEAMEGLQGAEIEEAAKNRLDLLSADPKTYALPYFSVQAQSLLSAMAAGSREAGPAGTAMRTAFEKQLDLVRQLGGGEDRGGFGAVSLFDGAFIHVNELNWESESLRRHVGDAVPAAEPELEKSRRDLALQLQLGARKQGARYDHEPDGRVFVRLERGIHASPLDEALVRGIREGHEPVLEWDQGFVCAWPEFQFDEYPMKAKRKRILYFNADAFRADHMFLTKSQMKVRFSKRAKLDPGNDAREHLAGLKLGVIVDLLNKVKAAGRFDKALADRMARHARLETESLRLLLSAHPIWRKQPAYSQDEIAAERSAAISEVEFWNSWAARNQWTLIQEKLERDLEAMRRP